MYQHKLDGLAICWIVGGLVLTTVFVMKALTGEILPIERAQAAIASSQQGTSQLAYENIESIRVGDRVMAGNPESPEPINTSVDPAHWKKLTLYATEVWENGTVDDIHIETLQPPVWIEAHGVQVGALVPIPLDLVEMGLPEDLNAVVLAVTGCPPLREGPGRVVLTTVNHLNCHVFDLIVQDANGSRNTIGVTGSHKFYSCARKAWVSVENLERGEALLGLQGRLTVVDRNRRPGTHRVYNLTVEYDHVYCVSLSEALAHNNCPKGGPHGRMPRPRPAGMQSHHVIADAATELPRDEGAAVLMLRGHHQQTSSYGNPARVDYEKEMLAAGRAEELFEENIDEILTIAASDPNVPDDYYDDAIVSTWEYFLEVGPENYYPSP